MSSSWGTSWWTSWGNSWDLAASAPLSSDLIDVGFGAQTHGGGPIAGSEIAFSGVTPTPTPTEENSGGWKYPHPKLRTPEETRRERIRLGILPPDVQKTVAKAAKKAVATAKYKAANVEPPLAPIALDSILVQPQGTIGRDLQIWLSVDAANRNQALRQELKRQQIAWDAAYQEALQFEIDRLVQEWQDNEDAQVLTLMYQHYMH